GIDHAGSNTHDRSVRFYFFSSSRRHTRSKRDWSSDVCSSDLIENPPLPRFHEVNLAGEGRVFNLILTLQPYATLQGDLPEELAQGPLCDRSANRTAVRPRLSIPLPVARSSVAPKFALDLFPEASRPRHPR